MRQFPLRAQIYIWSVIALGAVALGISFAWVKNWSQQPPVYWMIWGGGCVLAVLSAFRKVNLLGQRRSGNDADEGNSTISLGFVPTFLLLLLLGPFQAMIAGSLNAICTTCHPRRSYYYQVLFSVASVCLSVLTAGAILRPFGLPPENFAELPTVMTLDEPGAIVKVLGIGLAITGYYVVNTASVALVISLISKQSPLKVWHKSYVWVGISYFVGASCASLALGLIPYAAAHPWTVLAVSLIAIPVPASIFYVLRYHRVRELEKDLHISQLETGKAELERINADLKRSEEELQHLYTSTVESLALAIDAKDRFTKEHINRVRTWAISIAEEMGLTGDHLQAVKTGALLHDIGKLAVPENILNKPGRLNAQEFEEIKLHPEKGASILLPVNFPFPVLPIVRSHHERWDGTGYPDGLKGEEIPLGARILAVADVYDALTMDRPYRSGWSQDQAVEYIRENAGTHFDPEVVENFLRVLEYSPRLHIPKNTDTLTETLRVAEEPTQGLDRTSLEYMLVYEIGHTLSTTMNLEDTLSVLANKVRNVFTASTCAIFLKTGNGVLHARRTVGVNCHAFDFARVAVGDGVTGNVAATGHGFVGEYVTGDLARVSETGNWEPLHSFLCTALIYEGEILGTINLYHEKPGAFDEKDVRILNSVAHQAARHIFEARETDRSRESANTDAPTGLYNAQYLGMILDKELQRAKQENRPLTVLALDIDNFKPVNDRLTQKVGDDILRDLGNKFQTALRASDSVARYSGDSFVVVLPQTGPNETYIVIEKLRTAVAQLDLANYGEGADDIRISVSIGAATFPTDSAEPARLIAAADRAMSREKRERKSVLGKESELKLVG
jgi:diguanylate cyclase (GGDEF)-like protein/putative nucleotidyltransferase with HDIG domain